MACARRPACERLLHAATHCRPFLLGDATVEAAVGDDLDVAVRPRHIDEHAVVRVRCPRRRAARRSPAPAAAASRRGSASSGFELASTAKRISPPWPLSVSVIACSMACSVGGIEGAAQRSSRAEQMTSDVERQAHQRPEAPPPPKAPPPPLQPPPPPTSHRRRAATAEAAATIRRGRAGPDLPSRRRLRRRASAKTNAITAAPIAMASVLVRNQTITAAMPAGRRSAAEPAEHSSQDAAADEHEHQQQRQCIAERRRRRAALELAQAPAAARLRPARSCGRWPRDAAEEIAVAKARHDHLRDDAIREHVGQRAFQARSPLRCAPRGRLSRRAARAVVDALAPELPWLGHANARIARSLPAASSARSARRSGCPSALRMRAAAVRALRSAQRSVCR